MNTLNIFGDTVDSVQSGLETEKKNTNIVFQIPSEESNALVVKFLRDPRTQKPIIQYDAFSHSVSDGDNGKRFHPCRKSLLGDGEVSPERDALQKAIDNMSAIKKEAIASGDTDGKYKTTPEFIKNKKIADTFKTKRFGYVYAVKPNSDTVFAIKLGTALLNRIIGVEGNHYRKEVPSIIKELQSQGKSPYIINDAEKNKVGWVKIWKTGEKLSTEYFIEEATVQVVREINGKKQRVIEDQEFDLGPKIASSNLTFDDFVDVVEYEKTQNMWSLEESYDFVNSMGLKVPERVIQQSKNNNTTEAHEELHGFAAGATVADPTLVPNF